MYLIDGILFYFHLFRTVQGIKVNHTYIRDKINHTVKKKIDETYPKKSLKERPLTSRQTPRRYKPLFLLELCTLDEHYTISFFLLN
jgi:hypothetical protein